MFKVNTIKNIYINTFILYRYIQFIKSDSKDMYNVTKHLYYIMLLLYLKTLFKEFSKVSKKILRPCAALASEPLALRDQKKSVCVTVGL